MPLDLGKYDGRYVAILYGSSVIIGRLRIGKIIELKDSVTSHKPLEYPHGTYYAKKYGFEDVRTVELNERNINAVRDVTDEIYKSLEHFKIFFTPYPFGEPDYEILKNAEKIFHTSNPEKLCKGLSRISKLKGDIEQIKKTMKEKKEIPERLPIAYYP